MNPEQIIAAQKIGAIILETIDDAGELGAPSGVLYAGLQTAGCTLNQYQSFLGTMVGKGFVVNTDHCLTITPEGKSFLKVLKDSLVRRGHLRAPVPA